MSHAVVHWEIGGHDLESLDSFYRGLFGWEPESFGPDYRVVRPNEGLGGGLMRCPDDVPPFVTIYVSVDDVDTTLAKVKDLGGTLVVSPTPIPEVGTFAVFQDPEGNAIGILKPMESYLPS